MNLTKLEIDSSNSDSFKASLDRQTALKEAKKLFIKHIKLALEAEKASARFYHQIRVINHLDAAFFCLRKYSLLPDVKPYMAVLASIRARIGSKYGCKYCKQDLSKRLRYKLGLMSSVEKRDYERSCASRKEVGMR